MAQAPALTSLNLMSGDQVQLEYTVSDNDGTAVDLTGGSGRFAIARRITDTPTIDSDASPQTVTISVIDAANGRVDVIVTDENTEALEGDYYYEFKWTDSSGREAVIARGHMTFNANLL